MQLAIFYLIDLELLSSFSNESPKEDFLKELSEVHKNRQLLDILNLVEDY